MQSKSTCPRPHGEQRQSANLLLGTGLALVKRWLGTSQAPYPRKGLGSRPGMKPLSCTLTRSTTQANLALGCWVLARGLQRNAALSLTTVPASRKHKALLCTKKMLSLRAPGSRAGFLGMQAVQSHAPLHQHLEGSHAGFHPPLLPSCHS